MEDQDILVVVDDTLAIGPKTADDMHVRLGMDWSIDPISPEMDSLGSLGSFGLDNEDCLRRFSSSFIRVCIFKHVDYQISLDCSRLMYYLLVYLSKAVYWLWVGYQTVRTGINDESA